MTTSALLLTILPGIAWDQTSVAITDLPARLEVKQRSTTLVPGTDKQLSLTVDDITAGQVIASLAHADGSTVLAPRSFRTGDAAAFRFAEQPYVLTLERLTNVLIGDDFATFSIAEPKPPGLTEQQRIERLIKAVEDLDGAVFVRNRQEHSAKEAAEHLRSKLSAAGGRIKTADEFIEHLASKSSLTGEPYTIRFNDGKTRPAGEFLKEELSKLALVRP